MRSPRPSSRPAGSPSSSPRSPRQGRRVTWAGGLAALALLAGACSQSGGNDEAGTGGGPATTGEATTTAPTETTTPETTTTGLPPLDPAEFSPCSLLSEQDVIGVLGGEPGDAQRTLDETTLSMDLCARTDQGDAYTVVVAYVAWDEENLPGITGQLSDRQELDLGDESVVGRNDNGDWIAGVVEGGRGLKVILYQRSKGPLQAEQARELAEIAWGKLPANPPVGGRFLPDPCKELGDDVLEPVLGEIVLARGSQVRSALHCGFLGEDGAALTLLIGGTPNAVADAKEWVQADHYRPLDIGEAGAIKDGHNSVIIALDADTSITADLRGNIRGERGTTLSEERADLYGAILDVGESFN